MRKKKRFNTVEEEVEAIRREPAFRALVEDLKSQTPEQRERLEEWLEGETRKEDDDAENAKD